MAAPLYRDDRVSLRVTDDGTVKVYLLSPEPQRLEVIDAGGHHVVDEVF